MPPPPPPKKKPPPPPQTPPTPPPPPPPHYVLDISLAKGECSRLSIITTGGREEIIHGDIFRGKKGISADRGNDDGVLFKKVVCSTLDGDFK